MAHRVTLVPGDGIGPEVAEATRLVLDATGVAIEWDVQQAGVVALEREGTTLPETVLDAIRRSRVALKGPITTPVGTGFRSVNVALRQELDLFAAVRPSRSLAGVPTRHDGVDVVVIRENTEDLYRGIEFARGSDALARLRDAVRSLRGDEIHVRVPRRHAGERSRRPDGGEQVELVTQRDVHAPEACPDGRRDRPLERHSRTPD